MHIITYATSCTQLIGEFLDLEECRKFAGKARRWKFGNLEIWAFAVLIERFRKVSGNSLKLVATHHLVQGVNH